MIFRYRQLTGEVLRTQGCHAWQSARATVMLTTSGGVILDGRPMRRLQPHLCRANMGHTIQSEGAAVIIVVYVPDIRCVRIGDFEIG